MLKTITTFATAGVLALGLTTAAMAGKGAVAGAPPIPPGAIEAAFDAAGLAGVAITFDPVAGTYTVTFPNGLSRTFSSETVAAYMAAYL